MERYTDTISGEELYGYKDSVCKRYYKDKSMTILHRLDGPAVEYVNGYKAWWIDGKRHRPDGPAVEDAYGRKEWWIDGKRHRPDGPAVEFADGYKVWYVDGKRHRLDGPAIEAAYGSNSWYVNGVYIMKTNPSGKIVDRME